MQSKASLAGRLTPAYRRGLRELMAHYEVDVISCVLWHNRTPWFLEPRRCLDSFFLFPLRGELDLTVDGRRWRVTPGSYLALPESKLHALRLRPGFARLEQIALHIHLNDRWGRSLLARFKKPVVRLADAERWRGVLLDLAALLATDRDLGRAWGTQLVRELVAERLREEHGAALAPQPGDPRIGQVLERMREELASPQLSVESLAARIGLTAVQMRKLFRRETRTSPQRYLHRLRLEKAARLLRHSTQTMKEIAAECGFASTHYFHRVFREAFRATPGDYRDRESL